MNMNIKEILLNKNIAISNLLELNNYFTHNIILSPSKEVNHERSHLMSNGFVLMNNNCPQFLSLSTTKTLTKNSSIISRNIKKNLISKNFTPLISNKSANKLNYYKSKNFPVISQTFSQNISSFENNKFSSNYSKTEENYLQDSLKKMDLKRSYNQIAIRTDNRILKNSISQRIFHTIKNNLNISKTNKKKRKREYSAK